MWRGALWERKRRFQRQRGTANCLRTGRSSDFSLRCDDAVLFFPFLILPTDGNQSCLILTVTVRVSYLICRRQVHLGKRGILWRSSLFLSQSHLGCVLRRQFLEASSILPNTRFLNQLCVLFHSHLLGVALKFASRIITGEPAVARPRSYLLLTRLCWEKLCPARADPLCKNPHSAPQRQASLRESFRR